jgi:5-formyltetrahydrofolate cyclo-ligase
MTTATIVRDHENSDEPSAKSAIRKQLLEQRRQRSSADQAAAEAAICARLLTWWQANPVSSLGVYHPIRREPDLTSFYNALRGQGVHLSLPIIRGTALPLEFIAWIPGETLVKDALGTLIPASGVTVQPQALIIPCLGFNAEHLRLGYGGGFYDRTLVQSPRPFSIGVAYSDAEVIFAGEEHDIALDLIVTGP